MAARVSRVVLSALAFLLSAQAGFIMALPFIREHLDSRYLLSGSALLLVALALMFIPARAYADESNLPIRHVPVLALVTAGSVALLGALLAIGVE